MSIFLLKKHNNPEVTHKVCKWSAMPKTEGQ